MSIIRFTNCQLALPDGSLRRDDLFIDATAGKLISGQQYFYNARKAVSRVIDLQGAILAPGFIDAQINGAYSKDFSVFEGEEEKYLEDLDEVSRRIVETGTTAYVPTVITQRPDMYPKILPLLKPRSINNGAHVLGYHAEGTPRRPLLPPFRNLTITHHTGPFLAPCKKGCHNEHYLIEAPEGIKSFDEAYSAEALDQPGVKVITAAPDVPGVLSAITPVTERGVTFSIGHSNASVELATAAVGHGATWVTHLFNAMPQMHHRNPGVIGVLGAKKEADRPFYGIIADAIHVHPSAVRLAYDCHPNGAVLVTDAMSLMNPRLPDGRHDWREGRYITKTGLSLFVDGTDTLAGSAISMDHCVRNLADFTSISLGKAIRCATWNVAQMLGGEVKERKGALLPGKDADLVVLSEEGNTRTEDLREAFGKYGNVTDAIVMSDRDTGRSRGFGFVTLSSEDETTKAIEGMNGYELQGRQLRTAVEVETTAAPRQDGSANNSPSSTSGGW
ncbi:Metallo-dependent hydrolase [Pseudohyphozyma bogoriensis]|nr:Metallo-dependent hydrolase [Pseudohyphozyma bogoriensis]